MRGFVARSRFSTAAFFLALAACSSNHSDEAGESLIAHLDQATCASAQDWAQDVDYKVGQAVRYKGAVYEVLQAHTSSGCKTPDKDLTLYKQADCSLCGVGVGNNDAGSNDKDAGNNNNGGNPPPGGGGAKRVVGYYTAWAIYARKHNVADIQADKLTHINYGFANIQNGQVVLGDNYADTDKVNDGDSWSDPQGAVHGNFHQLQILKQKHPGLKTLISIGGWTWSVGFSDAAATDSSRATFASSAVQFIQKYGFDGIDLDWEFPVLGGNNIPHRPEDGQNYVALLAEIRKQLDATGGEHKLLTVASPSGADKFGVLDLKAMAKSIDWFNLETYDFHGGWENKTGFNAPMKAPGDPMKYSVTDAVQGYLDQGVSPSQMNLGLAFYGHNWAGVGSANNGLGQPATGPAMGSWENGSVDYKDVAKNYIGNGDWQKFWDDTAQVPWIYSASKQEMVTYDDPQSIGIKVDYLKSVGLGGAMFWETSADNGDLLDAVNQHLK